MSTRIGKDGKRTRPHVCGKNCPVRVVTLKEENGGMNDEELSLLRSYANGPKIWDATALMPAVISLQDQGLIEPDAERSPAQRLTEKGRQILAHLSTNSDN